jgi:hypothetical protein
MTIAQPPKQTLEEIMANIAAMAAQNPATLVQAMTKVQEKVARGKEIWLDGVEPMDFPEFCVAIDGMAMYEHQDKVFRAAGILTAWDIVGGSRKVQELVLTWGKGSGKDFMVARLVAYVAFVLCSLRQDPAEFIGTLAKYSKLSIINIAPTAVQARRVFFYYLKLFINTKLFERFITDPKEQILADEVRFYRMNDDGKQYMPVAIYSMHSNASSLEGYNIFAWCMDEADAFVSTDEKSIADELHEILRSSASTRFPGRWLGMVISYPRVEDGFLLRLMDRGKTEKSMYCDLAGTAIVNPRFDPESEDVQSDYRNDPTRARALYECIPAAAVNGFFEYPDLVNAAVDKNMVPVASISYEPLDVALQNGEMRHYMTAICGMINRRAGHSYFLGADAGLKKDSYTLSVWHTEDTSDAFKYICPQCGNDPNIGRHANYKQFIYGDRRPYSEDMWCGNCYDSAIEHFTLSNDISKNTVNMFGWFERIDAQVSGKEVVMKDSYGNAHSMNMPHIYEDLIVRILPTRAKQKGQSDRPVDMVGAGELVERLVRELGIVKARLDPHQTQSLSQSVLRNTGADIGEISFSNPEQYRRGRLVKALLYASKLSLLPNDVRDKEWRQLQLVNASKLDHPAIGSKDIWDSESVAIWCAATTKCSGLESMFI